MENKTFISEVKYKRTFNLGNYESETIELTLTIGEGETRKTPELIKGLQIVTEASTKKGKS